MSEDLTKATSKPLPLKHVDPKEHYALSLAQTRVWVEYRLHPSTLFYNIAHVYDLAGNLDTARLQQSLQQIVNRHEILRSNFIEIHGEPVQVVRDGVSIPLPIIDLSGYEEGVRKDFEQRIITQELNKPFNLKDDLLVRARLIRLDVEEYIFTLVMHHIVGDRWSTSILYKELSTIYNTLGSGQAISLPSLPIQYKDYAEWERHPENTLRKRDHAYWLQELGGELPVLDLPLDKPRPTTQTFRGQIERTKLDTRALEQLKRLSSSMNVTLFMLLFSTFNTLLSKLSGQTDIIAGTFLANRQRKELVNLIGILFNNLPIRIDLSGNPSFQVFTEQVRDKMLDAFSHMHYSYDELVRDLPTSRTGSRASLYNATFQLYYKRVHELNLRDLQIQKRRIVSGTIYDLMGYAQERTDGLHLWFNCNTDLFYPDSVKRFLVYFKTLLQDIIRVPDTPISDLEILPSEERQQLLSTFNLTGGPYPRENTLHELFEAQAGKTPSQTAILTTDHPKANRTISYEELNHRANQLARCLRRQGVKPGNVVGILLERSIETLVAYLAVLKAGAVCLSLDVNFPRERIRYMTKDTNAQVVITTRAVRSRNYLLKSTQQIDVHDEKIDGEEKWNLRSLAGAEDIASIIYTSGSTGRPKGVKLQHKGLVNQILHRINILGISGKETLCLSLSTGFVTMPLQTFSALSVGAQLILYSSTTIKDPVALFKQVDIDGTHVLETTVSTLNAYLSYIEENPTHRKPPLRQLRTLLVAGEKLRPDIARKFFHQYDQITLMNAYGQTECSGMTLSAPVPYSPEINRIVEGRPSRNNKVYILDDKQKLVPVGVKGEIYISGDGVSLGYVNKPRITDKVFLHHPFIPGERIFRTGDLGRMLPDGRIEVLGRIDELVKIRGYRVEPGEIEAVLRALEGLKACCVTSRENEHSEPFLVAYYTSEFPIKNQSLRAHLRKYLPDYMIPGFFVHLEQLPLNANGKTDKKALPAPQKKHEAGSIYKKPETELEMAMTQIWEAVLQKGNIGLHDDFFDLGGHSLQAVQIVTRIQDRFGVELPPTAIFEYPSIEKLVEVLEHAQVK